MVLRVTFLDESFEDVEDVIGYVISGKDNTLTVNIENSMPIVFNYEFVFSVRYINPEEEAEKADDDDAEAEFDVEFKNVISEEQLTKFMKRLFNGII